jgi:hypothetical protein
MNTMMNKPVAQILLNSAVAGTIGFLFLVVAFA